MNASRGHWSHTAIKLRGKMPVTHQQPLLARAWAFRSREPASSPSGVHIGKSGVASPGETKKVRSRPQRAQVSIQSQKLKSQPWA